MFRRPAFTSADVQRVHSQCGLRLWPICTAQRSKEPPGTARYGTKQQNDARPGLNARLSQERRRACWRLQPGWWLTVTIGGDHERLEIHCECTTRPGCAVVGGRSVRRAGAAVCVPPHGRRLGEFRAQSSACNHYQACLLARVVERSGQYIAFDAQRSDRRIGHHREKAWRAGWPSALCGGARTTRLAILQRGNSPGRRTVLANSRGCHARPMTIRLITRGGFCSSGIAGKPAAARPRIVPIWIH